MPKEILILLGIVLVVFVMYVLIIVATNEYKHNEERKIFNKQQKLKKLKK